MANFARSSRQNSRMGKLVQLIIQAPSSTTPDDILAIAASVYEGLSASEIQEIEQITHDRSNFMKSETEV